MILNGVVKVTKIYDEWLILRDNCYTCKHRHANICNAFNVELHDLDFSCDFHKRKNSGAFRRKRKKVNKEYMSRYEENSFSKANKIINNLSDGITHADPDFRKNIMMEKYNKDGCFFLRIEILDMNCKSEIVGDAAAGLPALAELIGRTFKKNDFSENLFKIFVAMIEKYMEDDNEN